MTGIYAPTVWARRILIALLAFMLAAAFVFVASAEPADAAKTTRDFSAEVTAGNPAKGGKANTYTITFTNLGPTETQRVGSLFVDFDAHGFVITGVDKPVTTDEFDNPTNLDWVVTSGLDSKVVISAFDGGERILVDDKVSVDVHVTAPAWIPPDDPNHYLLDAGADQEEHGDFRGGNKFTLKFGKPDAQVTFGGSLKECTAGAGGNLNHCFTGSEPATNGAEANTECGDPNDPTNNCPKAGTITVEADDAFCALNDCKALWVATGETGVFYLIIEIATADQGGSVKIIYEEPIGSGLKVAKNCNPPHRTTNCIDTDHFLFDRGVTYPLRFEVLDPRGGYR